MTSGDSLDVEPGRASTEAEGGRLGRRRGAPRAQQRCGGRQLSIYVHNVLVRGGLQLRPLLAMPSIIIIVL